MPLTHFGKAVRLLRIDCELYLYEMAEGMNMSPAELSGIETGRRPLTDAVLRDAIKFLMSRGVTEDQLATLQEFVQGNGR